MTKIFEFQPAPEDVVVARVVTLVHRLVDQEFPGAAPPPKRFARTVFTESDEPTMNHSVPSNENLAELREPRPKIPMQPQRPVTVTPESGLAQVHKRSSLWLWLVALALGLGILILMFLHRV